MFFFVTGFQLRRYGFRDLMAQLRENNQVWNWFLIILKVTEGAVPRVQYGTNQTAADRKPRGDWLR